MIESAKDNLRVKAGRGNINSLSDLMIIIQQPRNRGTKVLYRGQNIDKPLLPKFARIAKKIALPNPLQVEELMFDMFKRQSVPYISQPYPESDWDRLALAQHFGLPTRLLDWTANPLAGLWFAVESDPPNGENGVFWILRPDDSDFKHPTLSKSLFDLKRTYIFQPSHVTRRIAAQDGWFSVHKYLEEKGKFIPLEHNKYFKDKLECYIINRDSFSLIREDLTKIRINRFSLFPELPALCRSLEEEFLQGLK